MQQKHIEKEEFWMFTLTPFWKLNVEMLQLTILQCTEDIDIFNFTHIDE